MCGRFDVDRSNREIDKLLAQLPAGSARVKTGEVFPTSNALVLIRQGEDIAPAGMLWGFPRWQGNGVIINARAETALTSSMFKHALRNNPLAVPTTGFYEWKQAGKEKEKFIFRDPDAEVLYLAGFWKSFAEKCAYFTVLTTAPNGFMQPYHDRMPVLLQACEIDAWLRGTNLEQVLTRTPFEVIAKPAGNPTMAQNSLLH